MAPRRGKENASGNAVAAPALVLAVTAGPCKGAIFDEQVEKRRIGRGPKGNTVCVKDPSVSQKHAEVVWTGAAWTVTDLGSSNGTTLNGAELAQGAPAELKDGDVLCLGDSSVLKVSIVAAQACAPAAAAAPAPLRAAGGVPTVESFLNEQCELAVAKLQADMDTAMQALRAEADQAVAEIEAEA